MSRRRRRNDRRDRRTTCVRRLDDDVFPRVFQCLRRCADFALDGWRNARAFAAIARSRRSTTERNGMENFFSYSYVLRVNETLTNETRASSHRTTQVSALLASPFLLFANALSPITPRAASLADGAEAASTRMGRRGSAFEPRSPGRLVFSSPDRYVGTIHPRRTGHRARARSTHRSPSHRFSRDPSIHPSLILAVILVAFETCACVWVFSINIWFSDCLQKMMKTPRLTGGFVCLFT